MSNLTLTVERLKALKPLDIPKDEAVRERFIMLWDTLWGDGDKAYERESIYFHRLLASSNELQKCTSFSIFNAFIDLSVCGLSLEPGVRALCYLEPRNAVIGKDKADKNIYEKRCRLTISGYGELAMRIRAGHIKYADNPVLVYEEDEFSFSDKGGRKSVDYTCNYPHTTGHIIACYLHMVRADGSDDYAVMFEEDWLRLQAFSAERNKKWDDRQNQYIRIPNSLYTSGPNGSIDPGFLISKCIKHAFKTSMKLRIGKATVMEAEEPDFDDDIYGIEGDQGAKKGIRPFGNEPDMSAGVSIANAPTPGYVDDGAF